MRIHSSISPTNRRAKIRWWWWRCWRRWDWIHQTSELQCDVNTLSRSHSITTWSYQATATKDIWAKATISLSIYIYIISYIITNNKFGLSPLLNVLEEQLFLTLAVSFTCRKLYGSLVAVWYTSRIALFNYGGNLIYASLLDLSNSWAYTRRSP